MIAVVIPFYQIQPGLLHRALWSIARQQGSAAPQILVTDDGSPSPVEAELDGLPVWLLAQVRILRQNNGGPAAARNLALDALPPQVDMVAFLDSDDVWDEAHLANIDCARNAGAEFYFADHWRQEDSETRFSECGYRPRGPAIAGDCHDTTWCDPRSLMHSIVRRSPVGTSTVAIRRHWIGSNRFRTDLRAAGEDSLFWLNILRGEPRVACSAHCEAVYGRGVSVFNHRSWGDKRSLCTALDEMQAQQAFHRMFSGDPVARELIENRFRDLDLTFWQALFACIRRLQWSAARPATAYVGKRPFALLRMPRATVRAMRQQFKRKPA